MFLSYVALVLFPQVMQQQTAGNLNGHLMASCVKNVFTKYYKKSRYPSPSYYQ